MSRNLQTVREMETGDVDTLFSRLSARALPAVLRGIAEKWPLVQRARTGIAEASRYLLGFYEGAPVTAFFGKDDTSGRIFYTDNLAEVNFEQRKVTLEQVLDALQEQDVRESPRTVYMGSMALDYCLPGLRERNSLPAGGRPASTRIWIGNRSVVSAHYDVMENVACVCAGRRRFTLFPPEQIGNLYVGPLDFTPAGQQVSLIDVRDPDLERFPRFAEALEAALTAELAPGDAIYIPAMWWHGVEGLEDFNVLINHWWRDVPAHMAAPGDALLHAILELRDLPPPHRAAWKEIFDHYVFGYDERSLGHIPRERRGVLGPLDEATARKLRAALRNRLNR